MSATIYASRPWVQRYDKGVPASLKPYPEFPLFQYIRDNAKKYPDVAALVTSARAPVVGRTSSEITYKELDEMSDALAVGLGKLGVQKGDRVAILMPNCAQFVISFFAILKAGAIVCGTNSTYPPAKLQEQLENSGSTTVLTLTLFYTALKSIQKNTHVKNVIVANIKDYLPTITKTLFTIAKERQTGHRVIVLPTDHNFLEVIRNNMGQKPTVEVTANDPAVFQYTGGTTGVPKAAIALHKTLVANSLQNKSFLGEMKPGDGHVGAIPFFHVFGMVAVVILAASSAGTILLAPNPRDVPDVLDIIDTFHPNYYMGVPAMYNAINNHPDVLAGKYKLGSIRACVSGSAPLAISTKSKFEDLTGGKLIEGYGMSETPTSICVNPLDGENRAGSIGLPLPDTDILIVDVETGTKVMPVGEPGELIVRGPQLMLGYHNNPTETANALHLGPDGNVWLYTGDIAQMDSDGYFFIVDRKKDMALIGGFNVYPNNVEKVLIAHPAIQEVGVAVIPHPEKLGQECLKAWLVLKPGAMVTDKEIIDFAASKLAYYEVPTRIEYVTSMPRTTVGKVLRRELQQMEKERVV